jgi:hypothetical protein
VQRPLELAGAVAVIVGFGCLVRFFMVEGYLPAPFVFDTNDTFMDWFHTAYWAHNPGAYSVWKTIYFPLSFVITGVFADPRCYANGPFDARQCDWIASAAIVLSYMGCVIVSAVAFYRNDRRTATMRTIAVGLGGPLLFALERGNLIMLAYIAFVLIYGQILKSKSAVALAAGFLVNMKVYLLFPILAFAIKRQWRMLELMGLAALSIYLVSIVIVGAGSPLELASNISQWLTSSGISIWDQVIFSTTYQPYLLFDVYQYPIRDFVGQRTIDAAKLFIQYELMGSRGIAILCIAATWFYPKVVPLNRLVFFILMQSFIGQNPGGYSITLIVFLLFMERERNFAIGLSLLCCYLVSIPMDYSLATILEVDRTSWLSGRMAHVEYVLTLGAILRPMLFLVMLWALAIDTLKDVHRAAKCGPPLLGLRARPQAGQPIGRGQVHA